MYKQLKTENFVGFYTKLNATDTIRVVFGNDFNLLFVKLVIIAAKLNMCVCVCVCVCVCACACVCACV